MPDEKTLSLPPEEMRRLGYQVVDLLVDHFAGLADRKVSSVPDPAGLSASLRHAIPERGLPPAEVLDAVRAGLLADRVDVVKDQGRDALGQGADARGVGTGALPDEARRDDARGEDEADGLTVEAVDGEWYASGWSVEDPVRVLTRAKLNVLERQGRTDEYLALCLRTGEHLRYALKLLELSRLPEAVSHALKCLADAGEALTLAQRLRESGHLDEATRVGERGLRLRGRRAALGQWLGAVEEAQGRTRQALEAWLVAFREAPSLDSWRTVKRLAGPRWAKLKPEVTASLEKFHDRRLLAEVFLEEQEWDAAIRVADGHAQDHSVSATVADALVTRRPEWVIRASVKQAESLIAPTKSSLYPAAADWLRRAKAAYAHAGRTDEWQEYLLRLKEQYRRRPALMAQLTSL